MVSEIGSRQPRGLHRDDQRPSSENIRTSGFPERIGSTALDAYRSTILDNETDVAYFPGAEAI